MDIYVTMKFRCNNMFDQDDLDNWYGKNVSVTMMDAMQEMIDEEGSIESFAEDDAEILDVVEVK